MAVESRRLHTGPYTADTARGAVGFWVAFALGLDWVPSLAVYAVLGERPDCGLGPLLAVVALHVASSALLAFLCLRGRAEGEDGPCCAHGRPAALGGRGMPVGIEPEPSKVPGADIRTNCEALGTKYALTQRECEVLLLLARGNGLQKVQDELAISEGTAKTHRRNVYKKLRVRSRQELIDLVQTGSARTA